MQLDRYLERVGLDAPLAPTLDTLRRLHLAHLRAFPFDNVAIQRGGTIAVEPEAIERKFLGGGGGYCFEHNTLFATVLRELGFTVTTLLGRAGPPDKRALNHMTLRVDIDGEPWLADVGFGAEGPLEPIPLREGVRVAQGPIDYSLRRDAYHWTLAMHCGETSEDLYQFVDAPFTTADIEIANYYTSTHPASVFRRTFTIQRATTEERLILRPAVITRYGAGGRVDTPIEPKDVRRFARELFGVELGDELLLFERER